MREMKNEQVMIILWNNSFPMVFARRWLLMRKKMMSGMMHFWLGINESCIINNVCWFFFSQVCPVRILPPELFSFHLPLLQGPNQNGKQSSLVTM